MKKQNLSVAVLSLLLAGTAGCVRDDADRAKPLNTNIINFAPGTTRAPITDLPALQGSAAGFAVYAATADNSTSLLPGLDGTNLYRYSSGAWGWSNSAPEWPSGAGKYPMEFGAIYPVSAPGLSVNAQVNASGLGVELAFTVQPAGQQVDLVAATNTIAAQPATGVLPLTFEHVLSKVDLGVIAGVGSTPIVQAVSVGGVYNSGNYFPISNSASTEGVWYNSTATTDDYTYFGTLVPGGSGGATVLPVWSPSVSDNQTPNPVYSGSHSNHLMLLPTVGSIPGGIATWQPALRFDPTDPTKDDGSGKRQGYICLVYRMVRGTSNEVGYSDASFHPNYSGSQLDLNGYTGPLFVKAAWPLGNDADVTWASGKGYTYNIGLGTLGSCNGYLADDHFYDDKGNRTDLPIGSKDVGDKVRDGYFQIMMVVTPWDDQIQINQPAAISVPTSHILFDNTAHAPATQTIQVNTASPTGAWTLYSSGSWLKLSLDPSGAGANDNVSGTGSQTVYLVSDANISTTAARIANVFVNGYLDDVVTTVVQNADIASLPGVGTPFGTYTYAGAFWRADQQGERLIRISVGSSSANVGSWTAAVAWLDPRWDGDEILLSSDDSNDPGITWNYTTENPADAENYLLSGENRSVSGNVGVNGLISFRIGLKSSYSPTEAYPARYAVVTLNYNNGAKTQKLFLRQGHDPDYLMHPNDPITSGVYTSPTRPSARKISPYTITASDAQWATFSNGGASVTDHPQLAPNGGAFTAYPTQGGALFQFASPLAPRRAFHPIEPIGPISNWDTSVVPPGTYWDTLEAANEVCPKNYQLSYGIADFRRPAEGASNAPIDLVPESAATSTTSNVIGSETRQSLFAYPKSGNALASSANNDNLLFGYYADGFFDRRDHSSPVLGNASYSNSAASWSTTGSNNSKNAAFFGTVSFNPLAGSDRFNASLFVPLSGYRMQPDGRISQIGQFYHLWTSSLSSGANGWYLDYYLPTKSLSMVYPGNNLLAYTFTIRCVQNP